VVKLNVKFYVVFLLTSLIFISAFLFSALGFTDESGNLPNIQSEISNINTSWIDDELLRIDVMHETGEVSSVVVTLSDYIGAENNAPFIEIQAVDLDGAQLGIVKINNPLYPDGFARTNTAEADDRNILPDRCRDDGKENSGNEQISEICVASTTPTPSPQPPQETSPPEVPPSSPQSETEAAPPTTSNSAGLIIFIIVVLIAAGGTAYYFLFIKGRNRNDEDDEDCEYISEEDDGRGDDDK
jgi:hypothetical protein